VRLTPRNGKYTATMLVERAAFESGVLGLLASGRQKKPLQPSG
jgi:hypothetical protein